MLIVRRLDLGCQGIEKRLNYQKMLEKELIKKGSIEKGLKMICDATLA
jgi:hypothetical protein